MSTYELNTHIVDTLPILLHYIVYAMITKNVKPSRDTSSFSRVIYNKHRTASLIAITTIFVLVLGLGVAYAEPPEHLLNDALEGKQLWERIDQLQSKVNQTEVEREELESAQERFNEIRTLLNSYGMATPQQMEANPEYWRDYNDTPEDEGNAAVAQCGCPQKGTGKKR